MKLHAAIYLNQRGDRKVKKASSSKKMATKKFLTAAEDKKQDKKMIKKEVNKAMKKNK